MKTTTNILTEAQLEVSRKLQQNQKTFIVTFESEFGDTIIVNISAEN